MTTHSSQQAVQARGLDIDGGDLDVITPRDLFRAMCIARAMNENGMAEKLRAALVAAFEAAGVPCPACITAVCTPLH